MRRLFLVISVLSTIALSQDTKENAEFKLAVNLYNDKLYDLAAEQLKRFIETYPNTQQAIQARFYLGLTHMELQQYEAARMTFQNFALSYPENPQAPDAWWKVAEAYLALKNLPEAASAFERLKVFHPKSPRAPEALLKSAYYFNLAGVRDRTKKALRTIIQEYPTSNVIPEARLQLAIMSAEEKNYEQARVELKRILQKTADQTLKTKTFLLVGKTYEEQGRIDEAEKTYREILRSSQHTQDFAEASYRLGLLQQDGGKAFESITSFKNALTDTISTDSVLRQKALLAIGKSYFLLKDFSNALLHMDQLLRQTPPPEIALEAHRLAAAAFEEQKDYRRALGHYRAITLDTSKDVEKKIGYVGAGRVSRELKDLEQAVRYFQNFVNEYPNDPNAPSALFAIGEIYGNEFTGGDREKNAVLAYQNLLAQYPHSPLVDDALFHTAQLQEKTREPDQAMRSYTELIKHYPASPYVEGARGRIRWITTFEPTPTGASLSKLASLLATLIAGESKGESAFHLGQIYFNDLKDFGAAAKMFSSAVENKVGEPDLAEAYYLRARSLDLLAEKNQTSADSALQAYEKFLGGYPTHPHSGDAAAEIVILKISGSARTEPSKIAEEFVVNFPGSTMGDTVLLAAGNKLMKEGKHDKAALAYQQLLGWFPSSPLSEDALYHVGLAMEKAGKADSAMNAFASYLQRYPEGTRVGEVLGKKAEATLENGKPRESINLLRRLIDEFYYTPAAEDAQFDLARAYAAAGELDSAVIHCLRLLKAREENLFEKKTDLQTLYLLANLYQQKRDRPSAKKYYLAYLREGRAGEGAVDALSNMSEIYREERNLETAASYLKQALDISGKRELKQKLAALLSEIGDYSAAGAILGDLSNSAVTSEERVSLEHLLIIGLIRQGKIADAEARTRQLEKSHKEIDEHLAEIESERGSYYFKKQEYTPALNSFQRLIKEFKKSKFVPSAHYWIGKTYEATGQNQKALEKYAEVLKEFPNAEVLPKVYLALGNISYRTEKFDSAVAYYRKVVESPSTPKDLLPFAMNNLIEAYKAVGLLEAALELTRKFVDAYSEDESIQDKKIDIAVLYQKLGYHDQSILQLENLLETSDIEVEGEIRYYIGEAYFGKGNYERAILEFLKVPYLVTKKGRVDWTANAFYMSGQSYEKMGKYDEAIGMYKQIVDRPGIDQTFKAAAQKEIDRVNSLIKKPAKRSGE